MNHLVLVKYLGNWRYQVFTINILKCMVWPKMITIITLAYIQYYFFFNILHSELQHDSNVNNLDFRSTVL